MVEWIKNICLSPFKTGLEHMIPLVFNLLGKRILKIDRDKIIERSEYRDNRNNLYFNPLHLKEIEQDICLNLLKLEIGIINDLVVSIPIKGVLSETTNINIGEIGFIIGLCQKNMANVSIDSLENTNSYFTNNDLRENRDLIEAYNGIKMVLSEYFSSINLKIKTMNITLIDHFRVRIIDLEYGRNVFDIKKIYFYSDQDGAPSKKLVEVDNVTYHMLDKKLVIDGLDIDASIVNFLPDFYMEPSESLVHLSVIIHSLRLAKDGSSSHPETKIQEISLKIQPGLVIIDKLSSIAVGDFFLYKRTNVDPSDLNLLVFNTKTLLGTFNQTLQFKISNLGHTIEWARQLISTLGSVCDKVIIIELGKEEERLVALEQFKADIILGDDILDFTFQRIEIGQVVELFGVGLLYEDTKSLIKKISILDGKITLHGSSILSKEFGLETQTIGIDNGGENLEIIFDRASSTNILSTVDFVGKVIRKFASDKKSGGMVNLCITDSNISFKHERNHFHIQMKKSRICITTKSASDIVADVLMNGYLVCQLDIIQFGKVLMIKSLKLYVDPEIFDQMNYLFGTLSPESEPRVGTKQSEFDDIMSCSFIVEDIMELESTIDQCTLSISERSSNLKILVKSFTNLMDIMVNDYFEDLPENMDFKLIISCMQVWFFDKLCPYNQNKNVPSFLCAILKDVFFGKKVKENQTQYKLRIKTGAIIDTASQNPEWKYFSKFPRSNFLNITVWMSESGYKIVIGLNPFVANIREEILVRLLAFFSNSHHMPSGQPLHIQYFSMGEVHLTLNYCPIILKKMNGFTIKDFNIVLSAQSLKDVGPMSNLWDGIIQNWKKDIDPDNIFQFIPNIKIIKPYASSIIYIIGQTSKYFKQAKNKRKIRAITQGINSGTDLVAKLVRFGFDQVWDLFN